MAAAAAVFAGSHGKPSRINQTQRPQRGNPGGPGISFRGAGGPAGEVRLSYIAMPRANDQSPIGEAMVWASRIMAVGLVMFLPALAGNWLDARLKTAFLGLIGLGLGFTAGLYWLVRMATPKKRP